MSSESKVTISIGAKAAIALMAAIPSTVGSLLASRGVLREDLSKEIGEQRVAIMREVEQTYARRDVNDQRWIAMQDLQAERLRRIEEKVDRVAGAVERVESRVNQVAK